MRSLESTSWARRAVVSGFGSCSLSPYKIDFMDVIFLDISSFAFNKWLAMIVSVVVVHDELYPFLIRKIIGATSSASRMVCFSISNMMLRKTSQEVTYVMIHHYLWIDPMCFVG
jgi:hypothetical protein